MNISTTVKSWLSRGAVTAVLLLAGLIPRSALAADTDLYVMQGGDLYRVNESTGVRTHVGATGEWFGATSLATDDPFPGENHWTAWAIWADTIWEISLDPDDEGSSGWISDSSWTGPTQMVYGHVGGLIAWQGGYLYTFDTSTHVVRQLGRKQWTGLTAMAYLDYNNNSDGSDLFVVQANSLWRVNVFTGKYVRLSDGDWSNTTAMTAGANTLYIACQNHLYKANPSTGSSTDLGAGWNSTSSMLWFADNSQLYAIQNAALYKVNTSTGSKTALGNDFWFGWTGMSSRVVGR